MTPIDQIKKEVEKEYPVLAEFILKDITPHLTERDERIKELEGMLSSWGDEISITELLSKYQNRKPKDFGHYQERQYPVSAVIDIIREIKQTLNK